LLRSPPLKISFSNIILLPRPFLSVIFARKVSSHQFCSYITCQLHNLFCVCLASASRPQIFCSCALRFRFAWLKPLQIILQLSSRVQSFLRSKKLCPSPGNTKQSARFILRGGAEPCLLFYTAYRLPCSHPKSAAAAITVRHMG